jgi:hypothetical protein
MIIGCGKVLHFFELRHGPEFTIQRELPAMILTPELRRSAGFINQDIPPVRADIRKAMDALFVARQQQRFIEPTRQEGKRVTAPMLRNMTGVTNELPGRHKNLFFNGYLQAGIVVKCRIQCSGQ